MGKEESWRKKVADIAAEYLKILNEVRQRGLEFRELKNLAVQEIPEYHRAQPLYDSGLRLYNTPEHPILRKEGTPQFPEQGVLQENVVTDPSEIWRALGIQEEPLGKKIVEALHTLTRMEVLANHLVELHVALIRLRMELAEFLREDWTLRSF